MDRGHDGPGSGGVFGVFLQERLLDRSNVLGDGSRIVQVLFDPSGQIRRAVGPYWPRSVAGSRSVAPVNRLAG